MRKMLMNIFKIQEKVAEILHRPENVWSMLFQTMTKGKTQKAYGALSVEGCAV